MHSYWLAQKFVVKTLNKKVYKLINFQVTISHVLLSTHNEGLYLTFAHLWGGGGVSETNRKKKLFLTIYIYLSRQLSGADCEVKESYTDKSFYLVWSTINKVLFINVQNNGSVLSIHKYFPWNKVIFGVIWRRLKGMSEKLVNSCSTLIQSWARDNCIALKK